MTTGDSRVRASNNCCKSSRVRRPISTPSSPVNAPSGNLRPSRCSNRPRFLVEWRPSAESPFQLLCNVLLYLTCADSATAHQLYERDERVC